MAPTPPVNTCSSHGQHPANDDQCKGVSHPRNSSTVGVDFTSLLSQLCHWAKLCNSKLCNSNYTFFFFCDSRYDSQTCRAVIHGLISPLSKKNERLLVLLSECKR